MENNRAIIILLCVLCPLLLAGEDYWGTSLPYYDRGIGGVPSGLGGAFVSLANDANACFYNPAGIALINHKIFNLNYQSSFIGGENLIYLGYIHNINPVSGLGFSFIWSGLGGLPVYDTDHVNLGTYSVSHYQLGISYGHKVSSRISLGLTGKLFYHSIWSYSANNVDCDLGSKISIAKDLNFGILFQNFIPVGYKLRRETEDLPLTIKTGLNYSIYRFLFIYEVDKTITSPSSPTPFVQHMGVRYNFAHYFAVNAGFDLSKIYLGINLKLESLDFYSGTIRSSEAGNLNFGVAYVFKEETKAEAEMEDFYQGIVAYQNKDYRTALKYFKKVKEKRDDPTADYYIRNSEAFLESEEWMSEEEKVLVGMKLELAKKSLGNQEYGKAISTLRDVININPDNDEAEELMANAKNTVKARTEALYKEAKILYDQKKYKESLDKCNVGLSLNPEHQPLLELKKENDTVLYDVLANERLAQQSQDEADAFYNLGLESFKNGNWSDAINNFTKSYERNPRPETKNYLDKAKQMLSESKLSAQQQKESEVHQKLGMDYYNKNKIVEAIKEFETAVNLYPENTVAQNSLNEARQKYDSMVNGPLENGKLALGEGRLSEAIQNFEVVLKIDPNNEIAKRFLEKSKSLIKDTIKLNLKQGQQEMEAGNYSRALDYYREAVKLDQNNKEGKAGINKCLAQLEGKVKEHVTRGVEYYNTKKYKAALDEFDAALAIDKEYLPAREWQEKTRKVFEENKVSLTIEEYLQSGTEQYQNKNYAQAKTYFQKILAIDNNNEQARNYIKKCDVELGKLQKQEEIAKVITDGLIQYRRKKYNEAIDIWKKAKQMDPNNKIIDEYVQFAEKAKEESMNKYYNDGVSSFEEGNLLKAQENLEKALQQNPNHTKARTKLSEVKSAIFEQISAAKKSGKENFNNGSYDKAIEQFKMILQFEAENDEIVDLIQTSDKIQTLQDEGNTFMEEQKYAEAIEKYNSILELNKGDLTAQSKMQKALLEGRRQASTWYNEGLQYYKNNDLKKAYIRFSSVVKADPNHEEAKNMVSKLETEIDNKVKDYYKTGMAYYDQGDYKNAITEFNKIVDLKGNYKDTSLLLTKANKIYSKRTEQDRQASEQKVQSYLLEGIKLYRDGKLKEAITEWEKVLRVSPNHSKALKYINRAKYKLSQLENL